MIKTRAREEPEEEQLDRTPSRTNITSAQHTTRIQPLNTKMNLDTNKETDQKSLYTEDSRQNSKFNWCFLCRKFRKVVDINKIKTPIKKKSSQFFDDDFEKSEAEKREERTKELWINSEIISIQRVENKRFEGQNDDQDFEEEDEEKKKLENHKKTFVQYLIINPEKSTFKNIWDIYINIGLALSFFLVPFTLAFDYEPPYDLIRKTYMWELLYDISFLINILLNFFTAFQQDIEWRFKLVDIAKAYIKSYFIFDVLSTFPGLITVESGNYYWIFNKIGLNKQIIERVFYFITLLLNLVYIIHNLACIWSLIGLRTEGSWLDRKNLNDDEKGNNKPDFDKDSTPQVYVRAVYFIITTLTTVGYGDFRGFTNNEYVFQMAVEFIGIGFFSFLMGSINNILVQESKLQDIIDEKIEDLDIWLRRLDKSRTNKHLPKGLYDNIKNYVEASFLLDFNLIHSYEFYVQLKPKLRYKLVNELFGSFKQNFYYMFEDDEFEAGQEFISDFLSQLYCRIYIPKSEIIKYGETIPELYLIYKGIVILSLKGVSKENEFFVLPTYSFFGDYQILMNLRSQIVYKSGENEHTYCMCLKKSKFLQLLEDYPDAKKFYHERAYARRIEFRRRLKRHQQRTMIKNPNHNKSQEDGKDSSDLSSDYSDESNDAQNYSNEEETTPKSSIQGGESPTLRRGGGHHPRQSMNPQNKSEGTQQRVGHLKQKLMARMSKYFNEDDDDEFNNDFSLEELEQISESEKFDNRAEIIKEANKAKSQQSAENIQKEMHNMSQAFQQMNASLEKNLKNVNKHIKGVQRGDLTSQSPEIEPLTQILNQLSQKLGKQVYSKIITQAVQQKFSPTQDQKNHGGDGIGYSLFKNLGIGSTNIKSESQMQEEDNNRHSNIINITRKQYLEDDKDQEDVEIQINTTNNQLENQTFQNVNNSPPDNKDYQDMFGSESDNDKNIIQNNVVKNGHHPDYDTDENQN